MLDTVKQITSFTQEERQLFATLQENEQILTVSLALFQFHCVWLVNKLCIDLIICNSNIRGKMYIKHFQVQYNVQR